MVAPITVTREYVVPFTLRVSKRISPGTYSSVTPRGSWAAARAVPIRSEGDDTEVAGAAPAGAALATGAAAIETPGAAAETSNAAKSDGAMRARGFRLRRDR